MNSLYIIDAVNFLFRSYYAIGNMTNPKGVSTNALFGFIRSFYKIMEDFSPDFVVAVFDGPNNKLSRTELYAEYKSHRAKMPEDLFPQIEKALEWCQLAGIPNISVPGVEADDTMGSMAAWAEKQGIKVFLCSSDKDLCQLVDDHIMMVNPSKNNLIVDKAKVKELFGVTPKQMIDYLAIVGDASDNIPGLEGFGPKTAASLLEEFGTLDQILANPEKVVGTKKQEILRRDREIALLSRKLATIDLNIDFCREEAFFHLKQPNLVALKTFYQEMNFLSLLKEMDTQQLTLSEKKEEGPVEYQLVEDEVTLCALIETLKKEKEVCLDTETTDIRPLHANLVGIGLGVQPAQAWYIPLNGKLPKAVVLEKLRELFSYPSFYGHNIKYDLHVLQNMGLAAPYISFDTMLASYLLTPQKHQHGLDELSFEKLDKKKIPIETLIGKGKNQLSMEEVPLDKITPYCCEDVDCTTRLKTLFEKELEARELTSVLTQIEIPLLPVLASMERRGIYVDPKKLQEMSQELAQTIGGLETAIHQLAGESFNLNSPKQLGKILFEKLGIKPPKKTQTGFSTSAEVLEELKEEHPIAQKILEYRTVEKLRSTYVDALPLQIHPKTGRIHCTFNQSVAATGRLSCQDPNLQNIPIRSTLGKKIREAFRPEKEAWSFISADYSQIELRLLAHLSEDPILLKAFNEGEDVHAYTAAVVFNAPLKEVSYEMRQKAKAVNFGILYGQQAFGLSQGLGIGYKEASAFIETYFQRYTRVKEYLEYCKESARQTGRVVTLTGRHRPIPEILNKNPMIRSASERLAINAPLQGTAADLIKIAMIQVDAYLKDHPHLGYMLLQIHDELLLEAPDAHIVELSSKVKEIMETVLKLKVPLTIDISVGKNWGEC